MREICREIRPDILHTHSGHAFLPGVLACRDAGRPILIATRRVDFPIEGLSRVKFRLGSVTFIAVTERTYGVV